MRFSSVATVVISIHLATALDNVFLSKLRYTANLGLQQRSETSAAAAQISLFDQEYYKSGGPIYLYTPGEFPIDYPGTELYLTNATVSGGLAQATNGAVIIIEHRFYGASNPTADHSVENLALNTIDQALDDFVYFAKNFKRPVPGGDQLTADRVPWVIMGRSYSGALGPWVMEQRPGVFWAAYSSSGVVEPQLDFHNYWDVVEEYMPANCSSDLRAIVSHIDHLIDTKRTKELKNVQTILGLPNSPYLDFVYALRFIVASWQSLDISPRISAQSDFYRFCDGIETKADGTVSNSPRGWGLQTALQNLGRWLSGPTGYLNLVCTAIGAPTVEDCVRYSGSTLAGSVEAGNLARSWTWTVCTEVGWQQVGPPRGRGIVSKHFSLEATAQFCYDAFPGAFRNPSVKDYQARVDKALRKRRGFKTYAERVFVVNGKRDPWVGVSLSAPAAKHIARNTTDRPLYLTDGFHCSDTVSENWERDASLSAVWAEAQETFKRWISEFQPVASTSIEA